MATYVLVHGGGHGGWCWDKLAPRLRAAGHDVRTPTLPGLAERAHELSPAIDLDAHIDDVVALLERDDLTDVVLVGHSYGGMVITGVADRALGRIGELVYLDAAHPLDGESLRDVAPVMMDMARSAGEVVEGVELVLLPIPEAGRFYGVEDDDDVAWMQEKLTPHPWRCFEQPLRLRDEAAVRALPRTNINCTAALAASEPERRARQVDGDRSFEIDTGHDLMITEPAAVAAMLLQVASS